MELEGQSDKPGQPATQVETSMPWLGPSSISRPNLALTLLALQSVSGIRTSTSIPRINFSRPPFSPPRASHGSAISPWGTQVFLVAMKMPDWPARCYAGKPGRLATSAVSEECNGFPGTGAFLRRQARRWTSGPAKMPKTWGIWEPHPTTSTKILDLLRMMRRLGRSWVSGA